MRWYKPTPEETKQQNTWQILEILSQCKFISAGCHAHANAHNARTCLSAHIFEDFVKV